MAVPELPGVKDTNGIMRFLREAKSELKKVTWPTRRELIAHTIRCIYLPLSFQQF